MPVLFSGQPGRVVAIQDPASTMTAKTVSVDGFGGFSSLKSILCQVVVSRQGNFQFMHTLGDGVFVYVFGDRVGQIQLSGIAFGGSCDGNGDMGMEKILQYYDQNRIAEKADPVRITIGNSTSFNSFLVGVTGNMSDPENRLFQFGLNLILIPEKKRS